MFNNMIQNSLRSLEMCQCNPSGENKSFFHPDQRSEGEKYFFHRINERVSEANE